MILSMAINLSLFICSVIPTDDAISQQLMWQAIQVKYPKATKNDSRQRLQKLIQKSKLLHHYHQGLNYAALSARAEKIARESRDRQRLTQIQIIFHKHPQLYLELFVLPAVIDAEIYHRLYQSPHSSARQSLLYAQSLLEKLMKDPKKFQNTYSDPRAEKSILSVSLKSGLKWGSIESAKNPASFDQRELSLWLQEIAYTTKVGEIYSQLIPHERGWIIAKRLTHLSNHEFRFNTLLITKPSYREWLDAEIIRLN